MSGAAYARTRENLMEFGGCSKIAKAFRLTIRQLKSLSDGQVGNRLTAIFKIMIAQHKGIRGQRSIEFSQHRDMLKNLECNIKQKLSAVININFTATHNEQRTAATITMPESDVNRIKMPEGATHFRLVQTLGVVSDYAFHPIAEAYEPLDRHLNGIGVVNYSDYIGLESDTIPETLLTTTLPMDNLTDKASVVQAVGISFYQQLGSIYYPLKQHGASKIIDIF